MFDAHRGLVENPVAALRAKRDWLTETVGAIERRLSAGESESRILRDVLGGEERTAFVSQGRVLAAQPGSFGDSFSAAAVIDE